MSKHISIRVAWHDNKWNGSICNHPGKNTYCVHLPRIYEEKNEENEQKNAGKDWSSLKVEELPPCKSESGGFMNKNSYSRIFNHPYSQTNRKSKAHLALEPKNIEIPPFSTFAVPFWWMLKTNQKDIKKSHPAIPKDGISPFNSPWVYSSETQEELLKTFFDPIQEEKSLSIFYLKGANPIDEDSKRLIVGIGTVKRKSNILKYETTKDDTYPLWDRLITHGIRPEEPDSEGILLPYHEYLALADDFILETAKGKKSKNDLINEIKLTLQETASREEVIDEFTYGSSWIENNTILIVLTKLKSIINRIRHHGIVKGHWENNILWIDSRIGKVKESMGPFPSFASALIAFGFKHGRSLEDDLREQDIIGKKDNPWKSWEEIINGNINTGDTLYSGDLPVYKQIWASETTERKELLMLLSRFELTDKQIKNWFDPDSRRKSGNNSSDLEIIHNPYLISENDKGDADHYPIAVEAIDNGLFEDRAIQGNHVPDKPQLVDSGIDPRRIRAIIISILKKAAETGDTLLSVNEIMECINNLTLQRPTAVPLNYISANIEFLKEKLQHFKSDSMEALQLEQYFEIDNSLRKILIARAKKSLDPLQEDWESLVKQTIADNGIHFDQFNNRHVAALEDQVKALKQITNKKLTVLHGLAGTGKTTVMGALFGSQQLINGGILLLAPTGKAKVKLGKMAGNEAFTIAQFLSKQNRFDWVHMKPKFTGPEKYKAEQTVIIDECSMLTEDDLYALIQSLDLGHVKRIILVGDPYQLPPIGAGRPFADFCAHLESIEPTDDDFAIADALARLKEVVRTVSGSDSDILTLASWYSGLKPTKNADTIFSKLGNNDQLNDLKIYCWNDEESLFNVMNSVLVKELGMDDHQDHLNLNKFLGIEGLKIDTQKIEAFQLLSPVKAPYWGSFNLNRNFQKHFRGSNRKTVHIGDYRIGLHDKVIQTANERLEGYPDKVQYPISNGQLGIVKGIYLSYANVVFTGIGGEISFGYQPKGNYNNDPANLELAYAITIHKSQGSDFDYVFLVIPKTGKLISRELIYTALTRSKKKLILFVEGDSPHWIINLSKPQCSDTSRRNTHLFNVAVRMERSSIPFAIGLIHKTLKEGLIVRSKSEVIIANILFDEKVEFEYEKEYTGRNGQKRIPDFTFVDDAGETIILEHLGMLSIPTYKADWEKKLAFYKDNGFIMGETLFVTEESVNGAIDSLAILKVIKEIKGLL